MYQALYRKWRPKIFEDVLGQEHITETLKNQIVSGKPSHAYLFSGTRGTGKTSSAKILARAVNCESPVNGNPCNECYACKSSLSGSAVDIIEMDAASNNKVEDARMIRDEVVYTPAEFKYKVYIIDEAHMLTQSAFNALLKTLEEPPSHIVFIFATTEPHKFPATILSRCQRFDFKRIKPFDIAKRIRQIIEAEGCEITDEAVNLVVRVADGSMRDALSLLDQCVALGGKNIKSEDVAEIAGVSDPGFIIDFAKSILNGETAVSMLLVKKAYEKGFELSSAVDELLNCFRSIMIVKSIEDKAVALSVLEISESEVEVYYELSKSVSLERVMRYINILEETLNSRMFVGNPRLSLEIALTGMNKKPDLTEPQGILEKLCELENRLKNIESGRMVYNTNGIEDVASNKPKAEKLEPRAEKAEKAEETEINSFKEPKKKMPSAQEEDDTEEPYVYEAEEVSDYPIYEEEFKPSESTVSNETSDVWDDVLTIASKNSLIGFDKIIGDAKTVFSENGVDIFFANEGFLKIAQMNKFDVNIQNAYRSVCGKEFFVKFKIGIPEKSEKDNFSILMEKIKNSDNNVEFI